MNGLPRRSAFVAEVRHSDSLKEYRSQVPKKKSDLSVQDRLREVVRSMVMELGGQKQSASRLGVSQGYLSEFISGGRGGGAKLFEAIAAKYPTKLADILGLEAGAAGYRQSNRERAIQLLVNDGRGDEATIREAAERAAAALDAREDQSELKWVEMITPFIKAKRRS